MDEASGIVRTPHFGLPCDLVQVLPHLVTRREARDVDEPSRRSTEETLQLPTSLAIDRAVRRRRRFQKHELIPIWKVDNEVGHLAV